MFPHRSFAIVSKSLKRHSYMYKFAEYSSVSHDIKHVTVIGSGLMGAGIVQVAAQAGYKVTMVDVQDNALEKGKKIISSSLGRIAKKKHADDPTSAKAFVDKIFENITTSTDAANAVAESDLVVEAIVENMQIKQNLFKILDVAAPSHTIFTSNTSSLPIGDICQVTNRESLFAGLHFFNPVPQMKLVEIISTPKTSPETFQKLSDFTQSLQKVPVSCKDTPGYVNYNVSL